MTSVGETLRRARLQRNLELNRIADELKISAAMLKAIEEERFDKLPGGVFARSFVRQYARLLELDEDQIVGELKHVLQPSEMPEIPHEGRAPEAEIPLPRMSGWQAVSDHGVRWSSSVGALVLMVIVMLACAGAYAWWQRARHPATARVRGPVAERVSKPEVAVAPAPASSAGEPAAAAIAPPAAAALPPAESKPAEDKASASPGSPVLPAAAVNQASAASESADPNAAVRLEVKAQEPSWISVQTDGRVSFSGVLEANQTHAVSANRNVLLKLGNAGGVEVNFNGKAIGRLGGKGAVRTIQFTSGGFQIVPPEAPKPGPPAESPNPAPRTESPNPL